MQLLPPILCYFTHFYTTIHNFQFNAFDYQFSLLLLPPFFFFALQQTDLRRVFLSTPFTNTPFNSSRIAPSSNNNSNNFPLVSTFQWLRVSELSQANRKCPHLISFSWCAYLCSNIFEEELENSERCSPQEDHHVPFVPPRVYSLYYSAQVSSSVSVLSCNEAAFLQFKLWETLAESSICLPEMNDERRSVCWYVAV